MRQTLPRTAHSDVVGGYRLTDGSSGTADLAFSTLGKRKVVFSEVHQRLFGLNDPAAYLWRHLCEGTEPEAIVAELANAGVPREIASRHVSRTLNEWRRLGFKVPVCAMHSHQAREGLALTQTIAVGGLCISLQFPTRSIANLVMPVFEHLEHTEATSDVRITVVARRAGLSIVGTASRPVLCSTDGIVPTLKAELAKVVLQRSAYTVALHAASLVRNGRLLLVAGPNGAGKSTLSVALACAGFRFGGDDIALLDAAGNAIGVTFAPALKPGAWKLLRKLRPELATAAVFRRPDGTRVRYIAPERGAMTGPRPASWLVMLRRSNARTKLSSINPLAAMRCLLAGAFTPAQRLTVDGFKGLAATVNGAQCYELTSSDLEIAVELLTEVCS